MNKSWFRGFRYAKIALNIAIAPRHSRKIGAALFSGSTLISIGANDYTKSHPKQKWNLHAEHRAIIKRRYFQNGNHLVIYVYRETNDGKPAHSEPCANCKFLLREAGIKIIRYVDKNKKFREEIL